MATPRHPIPKRFRLSDKHYAGVYLVDAKTLHSIGGGGQSRDDACTIYAWESAPEVMRVYIDRGLTQASRWDAYGHELVHVLHDYLDWSRKQP